MLKYLTRRLLAFLPVLWAVVTLVFLALRLTPGDPSEALYAEALISPEQLAANRAALGLDRPLWQQYLTFAQDLLRGDLGRSFFTGRPVTATILEQLGATGQLGLAGLGVAVGLGFALGVAAAVRPRAMAAVPDVLIALSLSLPVAWIGLLSLWLTASLFPLSASALHLLLPALVLGFSTAGPIASVTRASLAATRGAAFMLAARARGVAGWHFLRHALRATLVPVIHMTALQAAFLFGGTVVTETVFARAGLGRLLIDALLRKDLPVVQGLALVIAGLYLSFNLAADLLSAALDPRLRSNP
jgi:ABC-type dipeptide/oligopeptide/nickel transport system permease component